MTRKCRENPASGPFSRLAWMGRHRAILLALVLGILAAATLSACGGEEKAELLPGKTAGDIDANLSLVEELVANGDCVGAENAAAAVREQVDALTGVDQRLKETLSDGAARLQEVIGECVEQSPQEDEETTASEEPDLEEVEKEERDEEKAQEEAEKEAEKEQKKEEKEEKEPPAKETPDQEEPKEEPEVPPTEPTNPPSGGVSPSTEAGGAE